jgi:hypothetical protein
MREEQKGEKEEKKELEKQREPNRLRTKDRVFKMEKGESKTANNAIIIYHMECRVAFSVSQSSWVVQNCASNSTNKWLK